MRDEGDRRGDRLTIKNVLAAKRRDYNIDVSIAYNSPTYKETGVRLPAYKALIPDERRLARS